MNPISYGAGCSQGPAKGSGTGTGAAQSATSALPADFIERCSDVRLERRMERRLPPVFCGWSWTNGGEDWGALGLSTPALALPRHCAGYVGYVGYCAVAGV